MSQIFVVSSVEIYAAYGPAGYHNRLLSDALGNFRTLLQHVTLSPVMGHYLDMVDNNKPNPANGTTPNENYAREVLQPFSIGLYELNWDGMQQLDNTGAPIPMYTQATMADSGAGSSVTSFTLPDFSRTLLPNTGAGTDHAWGSHHMVIGDAVQGGQIFGTMPTLALDGPDDAGEEGRWIPTIAVDQYAATLATWFDADATTLATVLPNPAAFSPSTLAFV